MIDRSDRRKGILLHILILGVVLIDTFMAGLKYSNVPAAALSAALCVLSAVSLVQVLKNSSKSYLICMISFLHFILVSILYGQSHGFCSILLIKQLPASRPFVLLALAAQLCFVGADFETLISPTKMHLMLILALLILSQSTIVIRKLSPAYRARQFVWKSFLVDTKFMVFNTDFKEVYNSVFENKQTSPGSIHIRIPTEHTMILTPKGENAGLVSDPSSEGTRIVMYNNNEFANSIDSNNNSNVHKIEFKTYKELVQTCYNDRRCAQNLILAIRTEPQTGNKQKFKIQFIFEMSNYVIVKITKFENLCGIRQNIKLIKFKSHLVGIFQHKLKTPLNTAIGHLFAAKDDDEIPMNVKHQYLQPALLNCTLQLYLVQDVLDFMATQVEHLNIFTQKVNLRKLLLEVYELVEFQCRMKDITITFRINNQSIKNSEQKVIIYTDPNKLSRVLINLLTNSYRYTAERGWIQLDIKSNHQLKQTQFTITDSGEGMNAEELHMLKSQLILYEQNPNKGVKTKSNKYSKTVGISLLITNKLIKLLSGDTSSLQASRQSNGGLSFSFTINDSSEPLSESSLGQSRQNNFIKQQSLRFLSRSQASAQNLKQISNFHPTNEQREKVSRKSGFRIMDRITRKKNSRSASLDNLDPEPSPQRPFILAAHQAQAYARPKQKVQPDHRKTTLAPQMVQQRYYQTKQMTSLSPNEANKIEPKTPHLMEQRQKILIVDDEPFNHETLSMMLKTLGYDSFMHAFNGQQCVEIVDKQHEDIGFIFMDIDMPIMSGVQATRILVDKMWCKQIKYIPIIGCTAHEDPESHMQCFDSGMLHVVVKPIFLKSLNEAFVCVRDFQDNTCNEHVLEKLKSITSISK